METDLPLYYVSSTKNKYVYQFGERFPYKVFVSFYRIIPNTSIYNILYKGRIVGYTKKGELKVLIEYDTDDWFF